MSDEGRAPGWYDDPSGPPGGQRWWNGISWGDQTRWNGPGPGANPYAAWGATPPTPPPRRRSPVPWILSGCLVLVLLVVGGCGSFIFVVAKATSGPREVVSDYFDDLERGDYATAAGRMCGQYAGVGEEGLRLAYPGPVLDADVRSVSRTNSRAEVTVDLTQGSASAYSATITAVEEGDEWKVCSLPEQVPG